MINIVILLGGLDESNHIICVSKVDVVTHTKYRYHPWLKGKKKTGAVTYAYLFAKDPPKIYLSVRPP